MVASLRGNMGTGTKEDESSIGRFWAAGFHNVRAPSRLVRVFTLMNLCFFNFPNILGPRPTANTAVRLCLYFLWRNKSTVALAAPLLNFIDNTREINSS